MRRPQFSLKTLLWLMAVVAAFCGGASWQRYRLRQALADVQDANDVLRQENENLLLEARSYKTYNRTLEIEAARSRAALEIEARRSASMLRQLNDKKAIAAIEAMGGSVILGDDGETPQTAARP